MFERFTHRARTAVVLAQDVARVFGHDTISTEHLLLGLLYRRENASVRTLESLGIDPGQLRRTVQHAAGRAAGAPQGHIPFSSLAKQALLSALREALQLGHDHIGTEHLLLGLVREDQSEAAQILAAAGANLANTRQHVMRLPAELGEAMDLPGSPTGDQHGLGRVLLCYRRQDLTSETVDVLQRACGVGLLVLQADDPDPLSTLRTEAIPPCEVVLVLIGPHWLTATTADGLPRIAGADDPVRAAIRAAMASHKPIVSALLGSAIMPRGDQLPADIRVLAEHEPIRVTAETLPEHVAALVRLHASDA